MVLDRVRKLAHNNIALTRTNGTDACALQVTAMPRIRARTTIDFIVIVCVAVKGRDEPVSKAINLIEGDHGRFTVLAPHGETLDRIRTLNCQLANARVCVMGMKRLVTNI